MKRITSPLLLTMSLSCFSQQERPNVLCLTYEDTSPQFIGCYGNAAAHTPTMDSLANNGGIRFNYAYSNSSVSSPSRSCIITGMDVNITGTGNHRYERPVPENVKGFPYYLRQAGYYTSNNVKTDYNISNPNFISEAWNESSGTAHWRKRPDKSTPFFSVFNINYSHQSYATRNEFNYYKTEILDKLEEKRKTNEADMIIPAFYRDDAEMHSLMTRVQNCINYTDQVMEGYLAQLRNDNLDQNTIIFLFADHGEGMPRAKTCPLGMGYRVPFIVWFPEKWKHLNPFQGQVIDDTQICFEDLAPTLLKLAGIECPPKLKGKAFLGENPEKREYIYASRNRISESPGIERSVIKGKYVYTRVFSPYTPTVKNQGYDYNCDILCSVRKNMYYGLLNEVQMEPFLPRVTEYLYDLETDQWETTNLAVNSAYTGILTELRIEMVRYVKETKDLGFMPEYEMQKRASGKTPLEVRNTNYNIDAIVDAALLSGQGATVLETQLNLLQNKDELIRYWAAVGIYNQGEQAVIHKETLVNALNNETFDGTRIELAAFLYNFCDYEPGAEILKEYAKGNDELLANDAVVKIQYLGEKTADFRELIDEIQPYWAENDQHYTVSPGVNTTQTIIRNMNVNPVSDQLENNKTYTIRNSLTGGYLTVRGNSTATSAEVTQTLSNSGAGAKWQFSEPTEGNHSIINPNSGFAMTIPSGNTVNGITPQQQAYTGANTQTWLMQPFQYGYKITNKATGKSLQVNGQSKLEGAKIAQWEWNGKSHFTWILEQINDTGIPSVKTDNSIIKINSINTDTGSIQVTYTQHQAGEVTLYICNLNGILVKQTIFPVQIPGNYTEQVNISSCNKEKYILELKFNDGKTSGKSTELFIMN